MQISVGHSPDSDDYFMFWALRENLLDAAGYDFCFNARDTAELNQAALDGVYDIVAISAAIYPQIRSKYLLLPFGASVGRNYGPKVVAARKYEITELNSLRIAIPGITTTAALLLQRIAPLANLVTYPISPYEIVFSALSRGEVDAALLIHEGQLSYSKRSLDVIVDLGRWWHEKTQLPLPLGLNAISKTLGNDNISRLSNLIKKSIDYAQNNFKSALTYLNAINRSRELDFTADDELSAYLAMYANCDSSALAPDVICGLEELLRPQFEGSVQIEWAP